MKSIFLILIVISLFIVCILLLNAFALAPLLFIIYVLALCAFTLPYLRRRFGDNIAFSVVLAAAVLPASDTLASLASLMLKCNVQASTSVPTLDFSSGLGFESKFSSLVCSIDCREYLLLTQIPYIDNYERTKDGSFDVRRFFLKNDAACRIFAASSLPESCISWLDPEEIQARYLLEKTTFDSSGVYQSIVDRIRSVNVFEYRTYREPPGWLLSAFYWHPASGVRSLSCRSVGVKVPTIEDVFARSLATAATGAQHGRL